MGGALDQLEGHSRLLDQPQRKNGSAYIVYSVTLKLSTGHQLIHEHLLRVNGFVDMLYLFMPRVRTTMTLTRSFAFVIGIPPLLLFVRLFYLLSFPRLFLDLNDGHLP